MLHGVFATVILLALLEFPMSEAVPSAPVSMLLVEEVSCCSESDRLLFVEPPGHCAIAEIG